MICQCENPDAYLDYEESVADEAQKFCLSCDGKVVAKVKQEITAEGFANLQSCVEGELNPNNFDIVEEVLLSKIKIGEFFKLKFDGKQIFQRGEYDRSLKRYWADGHNCDITKTLNGSRKVIIGFTY